jgi:chemotaxis signal transduction protein
MAASPAERRALLFTVGGVRLALRLPLVREVLPLEASRGEVEVRGEVVPALPLAVALGLSGPPGRFAVIGVGEPPAALRVDAVAGILDLGLAEVFQLPARTILPQPPPFLGALVAATGDVWLELGPAAASWVPLAPAADPPGPPPEADFGAGRELVFERGGRRWAAPLSFLVRVLESPRVFPVPLAPAAHRGLLYHERALHPVLDLPALFGGSPGPPAAAALIVDAGGAPVAVLADRIAGARETGEAVRPAWDALFPA